MQKSLIIIALFAMVSASISQQKNLQVLSQAVPESINFLAQEEPNAENIMEEAQADPAAPAEESHDDDGEKSTVTEEIKESPAGIEARISEEKAMAEWEKKQGLEPGVEIETLSKWEWIIITVS